VNERAAPYVLAAGQARSHMGTVPAIKAGAADTGGLFTFCDEMMPARTQGRRCMSTTRPTSVYTSSTAPAGPSGRGAARPGSGLFRLAAPPVPARLRHVSDSPVPFVGAVVPGGMEECFAKQSAYFSQLQGPPDPEQLAAIWAGHPGHIAGPPIEVAAAPATSRS
jgi:hypothetical protein